MKNEEIAEYLRQAAELNGQLGEDHKRTSFDRGARVVEDLTEKQLADGIKNDELKNITGIGKKLVTVITAMVKDGDLEWLEEYKTALAKMDTEEDGAVVDPVVEKRAKKEQPKKETKAAPPAQQAMVKAEKPKALLRTSEEVGALVGMYQSDKHNLIFPKAIRAEIPEGFAISIRSTKIDPQNTYKVSGKTCLSHVAKTQLANLAGVQFVGVTRVDDLSHPYVCGYSVTAAVKDFDGQYRTTIEEKWLDLREDDGHGNPGKTYAAIAAAAAHKNRDPSGEINKTREFIDGHCISKAKSRAVEKLLGLSRHYTPQDLQKDFIVPCLVLDSSDPMSKAAMINAHINATGAMFGPASLPPSPVARIAAPADYDDATATEEEGEGEWE